MRRTDNYAQNQIRVLLNDLQNATHADKKKAIKGFENYIETYHPEISDANVDYLFTGCVNGRSGHGLLYWCGVMADNHEGELKRICRPTLALLRWLVTHESESDRGNFYCTRFAQLPVPDLKLINFPNHITDNRLKKKKRLHGVGENENIFVLLAILMQDYRTPDGKPSKLDLDELLMYNDECHEKFEEWLEHSAEDFVPNFRGGAASGADENNRPAVWADVQFKCIPLQEGEDDSEKVEDEPEVIPPISDPLGISSADLRVIQSSYASGRLMKSKSGLLARRATNTLLPLQGSRKSSFGASGEGGSRRGTTFSPFSRIFEDSSDEDEEDDEDEDDTVGFGGGTSTKSAVSFADASSTKSGSGAASDSLKGESGKIEGSSKSVALSTNKEKKYVASVIPSDKNFSTLLFLSLVHGSISFNQLKSGLDHLQQSVTMQSGRRVNLVRSHFGLFVQCAEGLEFLKAYRKGVLRGGNDLQRRRRGSTFRSSTGTSGGGGGGGKDAPGNASSGDRRRQTLVAMTGTGADLASAAAAAAGTSFSTGGVDKGLERLKKSQITLDAAKVEAQRTLAPILERMRQSRRIRSAEKVLKRMNTILEYPRRMRAALDRNDLSEVVAIYARVQAVPTSETSMRILIKVKEAASLVVSELKMLCLNNLLSPNANHAALLRFGQIWLDLEGEGSYYELLRHCLIRQILSFIGQMREQRDKFVGDCAEAHDRGMEQNLLRQSPFLTGGSGGIASASRAGAGGGGMIGADGLDAEQSVSAIVKRTAQNSAARRRSMNHASLILGPEGLGAGEGGGMGVGVGEPDGLGGGGRGGGRRGSGAADNGSLATGRARVGGGGGGGMGGGSGASSGGMAAVGNLHNGGSTRRSRDYGTHTTVGQELQWHDDDNVEDLIDDKDEFAIDTDSDEGWFHGEEEEEERARGHSYHDEDEEGEGAFGVERDEDDDLNDDVIIEEGDVQWGGESSKGNNSNSSGTRRKNGRQSSVKFAGDDDDDDEDEEDAEDYGDSITGGLNSSWKGGGGGTAGGDLHGGVAVSYSLASTGSNSHQNPEAPSSHQKRELNHSLLLCSVVRQEYVEDMADLLAHWFPCLFRLVRVLSKIIAANGNVGGSSTSYMKSVSKTTATGGGGSGGIAGADTASSSSTAASSSSSSAVPSSSLSVNIAAHAGPGLSAAHYLSLNRGAVAPARILGAALNLYADHIKQAISGIHQGFNMLMLPTELVSAFNELDVYVNSNPAVTSLRQLFRQGNSSHGSSLFGNGGINNNDRVLHGQFYSSNPGTPFLSDSSGTPVNGAGLSMGLDYGPVHHNLGPSLSLPHLSQTIVDLSRGVRCENKTYEVIASSVLGNTLREPFHRAALQEVFEVYDGVEMMIRGEAALQDQALATALTTTTPTSTTAAGNSSTGTTPLTTPQQQGSNGSGSGGGAAGTTGGNGGSGKFFTFSGASVSAKNNFGSAGPVLRSRAQAAAPAAQIDLLNFTLPTSPFYESMTTLQKLSKQGELQLAQKIMDKLLDLSTELCRRKETSEATRKKAHVEAIQRQQQEQREQEEREAAARISAITALPAASPTAALLKRAQSSNMGMTKMSFLLRASSSNNNNNINYMQQSNSTTAFPSPLSRQGSSLFGTPNKDNYSRSSSSSSIRDPRASLLANLHQSSLFSLTSFSSPSSMMLPSPFTPGGRQRSSLGSLADGSSNNGDDEGDHDGKLEITIPSKVNQTPSLTYGMERNVTELNDLILRCLKNARSKVRRGEWVAQVVQSGVERVFTSFIEALRREAMRANSSSTGADLNDVLAFAAASSSSSSSSQVGSSSGGGGGSRRSSMKASGMGRRESAVQGQRKRSTMRSSNNVLVLETLEEELKFGDSDSRKAKLHIDLLRACVQLRCKCIPRIYAEILKTYPLPVAPRLSISAGEDSTHRPFGSIVGGAEGLGGYGGSLAHSSAAPNGTSFYAQALSMIPPPPTTTMTAAGGGGSGGGDKRASLKKSGKETGTAPGSEGARTGAGTAASKRDSSSGSALPPAPPHPAPVRQKSLLNKLFASTLNMDIVPDADVSDSDSDEDGVNGNGATGGGEGRGGSGKGSGKGSGRFNESFRAATADVDGMGENAAATVDAQLPNPTLMELLHAAIAERPVGLYQQNMRDIIVIEEEAASMYIGIKSKELRTTIFAGFAYLTHRELVNQWQPVVPHHDDPSASASASGGDGNVRMRGGDTLSMVRLPVHLSRVLFTLGSEQRLLASELGEMNISSGAVEEVSSSSASAAVSAGEEEQQSMNNNTNNNNTNDNGNRNDNDTMRASMAVVLEEEMMAREVLYKDHLYKQLCQGLLDIYKDLIERLRTNTFHDSEGSLTTVLGHNNIPAENGSSRSSRSGSGSGRDGGTAAGSSRRASKKNENGAFLDGFDGMIRDEGAIYDDSDSEKGSGKSSWKDQDTNGSSAPGTSSSSSSSNAEIPQPTTPYCLGQAVEELKFLKVLLEPLLGAGVYNDSTTTSSNNNNAQNPHRLRNLNQDMKVKDFIGTEFVSAAQLEASARMFAIL